MPEKAHPLRRALGGMGHSAGAGAAAGVVTSMAPLIVALVTGRALRLPSTISVTLATAGSRRRAVPLRLRALDGQPTADLGAVADGHPHGVGRGVTPSTSTCRARGPRSRPGSCPRPHGGHGGVGPRGSPGARNRGKARHRQGRRIRTSHGTHSWSRCLGMHLRGALDELHVERAAGHGVHMVDPPAGL